MAGEEERLLMRVCLAFLNKYIFWMFSRLGVLIRGFIGNDIYERQTSVFFESQAPLDPHFLARELQCFDSSCFVGPSFT